MTVRSRFSAADVEGVSHLRLTQYKHKYGLREVRKIICPCILSGSRRCMGYNAECHTEDWDHPATFKNIETGELLLVYQPYAGPYTDGDGLPKNSIDGLTARVTSFARDWHFTVRVSVEESWHYPGRTVLVEFRKRVQS